MRIAKLTTISDQFNLIAFLKFVHVLALIAFLTYASSTKMNGREIKWDALENVVASYHLWTKGTISLDGEKPSYFREPLPIVIGALHMALFTDIPKFDNTEPFDDEFDNEGRISQAKLKYPRELMASERYRIQISYINLFYIAGGLLVVWWLTKLMTDSYVWSTLSMLMTWVFFYNNYYYLYRPLSEYPSSLLIMLSSGLMILILRSKSVNLAVLLGVVLGALALTKAATLYVSVVAIFFVYSALVIYRQCSFIHAIKLFLASSLSLLILVTPWMLRNKLEFDDFALSQRGGGVLLTRAFKNQMTDDEYQGAWYVYAPAELKRIAWYRKTMHGEQSATRYARLYRNRPGDVEAIESGNVDAATSYFCKSRALLKKLAKEQGLDAKGADLQAEKIAKQMIKKDFAKHLKTTPIFAWRQIWSFGNTNPVQPSAGSIFTAIINFASFVALLALPLIAILRKQPVWFLFSLFPFGFFWFHALFSHAIPRYSAPLIPTSIIALILLLCAFIKPFGKNKSS